METTAMVRGRRFRFLPLALGGAALIVGLWVGLVRIGVALPGGMPPFAAFHGALMVCGFFGTLISLERAVALGHGWAYAAPSLSATGALMLFVGAPTAAMVAFLVAAILLTAASAVVLRRYPALFTAVLTIAAASWAVGTVVVLAGEPIAEITDWWLAFLLLTIAAERLELSRLLQSPPRVAQAAFALSVGLILAGAAYDNFAREAAMLTAIGYLTCAAWLLVYDVARRTVRQSGQPRFSAVCMLAGYLWLGIAGIHLVVAPPSTVAFAYDAVIHAVTIGFVLSMVFGHIPIILPAVTGLRVRYTAAAYASLVLLHLSVALRVLSNDFRWIDMRATSGVLTVIAIVGYGITALVLSLQSRERHLSRTIVQRMGRPGVPAQK